MTPQLKGLAELWRRNMEGNSGFSSLNTSNMCGFLRGNQPRSNLVRPPWKRCGITIITNKPNCKISYIISLCTETIIPSKMAITKKKPF